MSILTELSSVTKPPRPCGIPLRDHAAALASWEENRPGRPLAKSARGRVVRQLARGRCRLSARAVASRPSAETVQTEGPMVDVCLGLNSLGRLLAQRAPRPKAAARRRGGLADKNVLGSA
jgi:hypothetical protein